MSTTKGRKLVPVKGGIGGDGQARLKGRGRSRAGEPPRWTQQLKPGANCLILPEVVCPTSERHWAHMVGSLLVGIGQEHLTTSHNRSSRVVSNM